MTRRFAFIVIPRLDVLLAFVAAAFAMLPTRRVQWLRDDWLLLWAALEPETAPEGAAGVFPRPVAFLAWRLSGWVGGESPWPLHVLAGCCLFILLLGMSRWMDALGIERRSARAVAMASVALHAALIEPRLWAAAGNAFLAGALGIWAAWLLRPIHGLTAAETGRRATAGVLLIILAILARADAILFIFWPLAVYGAAGFSDASRVRLGGAVRWAAVLIAALGLLGWMLHSGGEWSLRPAHAGRLLRLILVPWGPALPEIAQALLGAAGLLLLTVAWYSGRFLVITVGVVSILGVLLGATLVSWQPAGRYTLVAVVGLSFGVGWVWDRQAGSSLGMSRALLIVWLGAQLTSSWTGSTVRELQSISAAESSLYRAIRARGPIVSDEFVLIDPPPMGWRAEVGDAENVVSAAVRGPVRVRFESSNALFGNSSDGAPASSFPTLHWIDGRWHWGEGD